MYRPLSQDRLEIRVLNPVAQDTTSKILKYSLRHIFPPEPPNPVKAVDASYIALSYTWGDSSDTLPICIDGHIQQVTRNLYDALTALRSEHRTSALPVWADAISINQQDVDERNREVKRMAEVYRRAHGVIIWLGVVPQTWSFRGHTPPFNVNEHFPINLIRHESDICTMDAERDLSKDILTAMAIFDRPYWKRIWILQELMMGDLDSIGFFWAGILHDIDTLSSLMTHFEILYVELSSTSARTPPLNFVAKLDILLDNPNNPKDPDLPDVAGMDLATMKPHVSRYLLRERLAALSSDLDPPAIEQLIDAHHQGTNFDIVTYHRKKFPDNLLYGLPAWETAMESVSGLMASICTYAEELANGEQWRRYHEKFKLESAVRERTSHLEGILYATACNFSTGIQCRNPDHVSDHFYHVMGQVMEGDCSDKRDFVYGVLGLLDRDLASNIEVDYLLDVPLVFTSFTAALILRQGLNVLCEYSEVSQSDSSNLPSWAIMLDPQRRNSPQGGKWSRWQDFRAGGITFASIDFSVDRRQLHCAAYLLHAEPSLEDQRYQEPEHLKRAMHDLLLSAQDPDAGTLSSYTHRRQQRRGDDLTDYMYDDICKIYAEFAVHGVDLASVLKQIIREYEDSRAGITVVVDALWLREMFLSPDCRLCLGRKGFDKQDVIAVLQGCNMPVVLHKNGEAYSFMGLCYVDGVMNGELVDENLVWQQIAIC